MRNGSWPPGCGAVTAVAMLSCSNGWVEVGKLLLRAAEVHFRVESVISVGPDIEATRTAGQKTMMS